MVSFSSPAAHLELVEFGDDGVGHDDDPLLAADEPFDEAAVFGQGHSVDDHVDVGQLRRDARRQSRAADVARRLAATVAATCADSKKKKHHLCCIYISNLFIFLIPPRLSTFGVLRTLCSKVKHCLYSIFSYLFGPLKLWPATSSYSTTELADLIGFRKRSHLGRAAWGRSRAESSDHRVDPRDPGPPI